MSFSSLSMTVSNLELLRDELFEEIRLRPDAQKVMKLCDYFRYLGCGQYLIALDRDGFKCSLYLGAKTYLDLLRLNKEKPDLNLDPYYLTKSKSTPLLDALAAGAYDLAENISAEMTMGLNESLENPYAYYYFAFIAYTVINKTIDNKSLSILNSYKGLLEGTGDTRFDVLRCLGDRDVENFNMTLIDLIRDWSEDIEGKRASENIDGYYDQTSANIFIEGMALIRIARLLNLQVDETYHFIPDELVNLNEPTFPDTFKVWG